ncbi:MAG TPA: hypothetical protein VFW33_10885 [Gemmataceae bacterium]|nr:hypothetical protein [Gemmataceae bacterium]
MKRLLAWLSTRFQREATQWKRVNLRPDHVDLGDGRKANDDPLVAGESYFRLWLVDMFLKNDRDWFHETHPAVYSVVRFKFGDQEEEVSHVAGQSLLKDLSAADSARSLGLNYELTSLVPFNGGAIEFEGGLVALKGKDDVKSFLKVLGDFSRLLVIPQLSTALDMVGTPLVNGITELFDSTGAAPQLRLHDAWTSPDDPNANVLRAGYFAMVGAPDGAYDSAKFWVKESRLRYGDTLAASRLLTGVHYMLFRVEKRDSRDDWDSLSAIQQPFQEAIDLLKAATRAKTPQLRAEMVDEAEHLVAAAKLATYQAKELAKEGGPRQVISGLEKRFADAKKRLGQGAFEADFSGKLSEAMHVAMPLAQARARGRMRRAELWAPHP